MLVEKYMHCPKCKKLLREYEQAFCQSCGAQLEWLVLEDYNKEQRETETTETMHCGSLKCVCGQMFSFKTQRSQIKCIHCGKQFNLSNTPGNNYKNL